MGRHLNEARHHAERIEHFHKHAGTAGYAQAHYHWAKLSELYSRAGSSKHGKNDAQVIRLIMATSETLMNEMKSKNEGEPNS